MVKKKNDAGHLNELCNTYIVVAVFSENISPCSIDDPGMSVCLANVNLIASNGKYNLI